jgi:acyl carrier protein
MQCQEYGQTCRRDDCNLLGKCCVKQKKEESAEKHSLLLIVQNLIADHLGIDSDCVRLSANLVDDLGADSLDLVELVMRVEQRFEFLISEEDAEKIHSVQQVVDYIVENTNGSVLEDKPKPIAPIEVHVEPVKTPMPDWAEAIVSVPDKFNSGTRIVGFRLKDGNDLLASEQTLRFERWLQSL